MSLNTTTTVQLLTVTAFLLTLLSLCSVSATPIIANGPCITSCATDELPQPIDQPDLVGPSYDGPDSRDTRGPLPEGPVDIILQGTGMDPSTYMDIPEGASSLVSMKLRVATSDAGGPIGEDNAITGLSIDVGADGDQEWKLSTEGVSRWGYQEVFSDNATRTSTIDPVSSSSFTSMADLRFVESAEITSATMKLRTRNVPINYGTTTGPATSGTTSIASEDIDGDGDLDIVVADGPSNTVTFHSNDDVTTPGTGDGTSFSSNSLGTPVAPAVVVPFDLDDDGDMDIVVGCAPNNRFQPDLVWLENPGTSTYPWSTHTVSIGMLSSDDIIIMDVDGDGDPDIISLSLLDGSITANINPGTPTSSWDQEAVDLGAEFASDISGGMNDDEPVIYASSDEGTYGHIKEYTPYNGSSGLTFNGTVITNTGAISAMTAYDIDGDGKLESVYYIKSRGEVHWAKDSGSGYWDDHLVTKNVWGVDGLEVSDLDGDGFVTIDVKTSSNGTMSTFLEPDIRTLGPWSGARSLNNGASTSFATRCDLDGDGTYTTLFADTSVGNAGWVTETYAVPDDLNITIDGASIYSNAGSLGLGSDIDLDVTAQLKTALADAMAEHDSDTLAPWAHSDGYGNHFEDVELAIQANEGRGVVLTSLEIEFSANLTIGENGPSLIDDVNSVIENQGTRVFLVVSGETKGAVELSIEELIYNFPPELQDGAEELTIQMDEESDNGQGLDLWTKFEDDRDPSYLVLYSLNGLDNIPVASEVKLSDNRYLEIDLSGSTDYYGKFGFKVTTLDGDGGTSTFNVTVDVDNVNDKPRAMLSTKDIMFEEETEWAALLTDLEMFADPEGDQLYFDVEYGDLEGAGLDAAEVQEKLELDLTNGILTLTPATNFSVYKAPLTVTCSDSLPISGESVTLLVTVTNLNDGPWIMAIPPVHLSEDQQPGLIMDLSPHIVDCDSTISSMHFSLSHADGSELQGEATFSILMVEGAPWLYLESITPNFNGEGDLVFTATDDALGSDMGLIHVVVNAVNDAPSIVITTLRTGQNISGLMVIAGNAYDPDSSFSVSIKVGGNDWVDLEGTDSWGYTLDTRGMEDGMYLIKAKVVDDRGTATYDYRAIFIRNTPLPTEGTDTDGDGINDIVDMFPSDPYEWSDLDLDGVGDNADEFPYNPDESVDTDGDGRGDNEDPAPFDPETWDESQLSNTNTNTGYPLVLIGPPILFGLGFIAMGGLFFILATEIGFVFMVTLIITLYTKLSQKKVIDHEVRGLIRGYIIANPGDHYSSIKKKLRLRNGTLAYHLKILEDNDLIMSKKDGIYKRYYPTRMKIDMSKVPVSTQESILNAIVDKPGISRNEICTDLDLSRQVVNYHTKGLANAGLITYHKKGRNTYYQPAENT